MFLIRSDEYPRRWFIVMFLKCIRVFQNQNLVFRHVATDLTNNFLISELEAKAYLGSTLSWYLIFEENAWYLIFEEKAWYLIFEENFWYLIFKAKTWYLIFERRFLFWTHSWLLKKQLIWEVRVDLFLANIQHSLELLMFHQDLMD